MSDFSYVVIIPARGGSKSIKKKNLQKINGKSLIRIGIEKFKCFSSISNIIVTSDDDEILSEAKTHGAIPWKRPKEISGDNDTSESSLKQVLENCQIIGSLEHIIFHQCTSPLLSTDSIRKAMIMFQATDSTCVFTVQEEYNPVWSSFQDKVDILNKDDLNRKSRQERTPLLIETGGLYVIDRDSFMKDFNRFGDTPNPLIVSKIESLDIDEEIDLIIAKQLIEL